MFFMYELQHYLITIILYNPDYHHHKRLLHDSFPCQNHTVGPCYRNDPVYVLRSDTVLINGKTYQKVDNLLFGYYTMTDCLFIREDTATGDVFRTDRYGAEQLAFSLNLEVGDTFVYSDPYYYDLEYVVDSITCYQGRKIIHLTTIPDGHHRTFGVGFEHYDRIVEGFGPSYGFWGLSTFFPTSCILFDDTLVYSLYPECGCNPVNCDIVHKNSEWITPSNIYPNPTCNFVNVDVPETIAGEYNIKVFSMLGTVLYDDNSSDSTYSIDVSQYPDGLYTIVVYYMGVYHVGKFVKY